MKGELGLMWVTVVMACTNVAGMSWLEWEQRSLPYGVGVGEWWEPAGGMAHQGL